MVKSEKKRILMIAPFAMTPKGTVQSRMMPIAKILKERGYEIEILIPPFDNFNDSGKIMNVDGIKIINLNVKDNIKPRINLKFLKNATPLFLDLTNYIYCNKNKYDLFYVFKPKGLSGFSALLLNILGKKYILDTDDWEGKGGWNDKGNYNKIFQFIFGYQEKSLLRKATKITVASKELEKICLSLGISKKKIYYVPNGYEILKIRKSDNNIKKEIIRKSNLYGKRVILYYSRFFEYPYKETYNLFKKILEKNPKAIFLLIGTGLNHEDEKIKKLVDKDRLDKRVIFAGWQNPETIQNYLEICDLAIYLFEDNLLNRTKCPAKLMEILSYGIPVVGSPVGQIKEFIINGENGFVYNGEDDFLDKVGILLEDNKLREKFSRNAKKIMKNKFSMRRYLKEEIFS